MKTFAKKSAALVYIYLVLSIPAINAARIKQARRAASSEIAKAGAHGSESLIQENGALKEQLQAMKEMAEFTSELSKLKAEAKTGYWGESWATCEQRLEDLERRERKVEQRYEAGMEDGNLNVAEAGRVGLKALSVASTLSRAGKNGCEWATSRQVNTSALNRVAVKVIEKHECGPQVREYLEKANADNVDPEEAKANALKIMFSIDCKLSTGEEMSPQAEETFAVLTQQEDEAEALALDAAQQFADQTQGVNGTALLQSQSSLQIFSVVGVFMSSLIAMLFFILACTVVATVLVSILTMIFMVLKALFMFVLGRIDRLEFKAEFSSIMKPFSTVLATTCSFFTTGFIGAFLSTPMLGMAVQVGTVVRAVNQLTGEDEGQSTKQSESSKIQE